MVYDFKLNIFKSKRDNDIVNYILSYIHVNYYTNKKYLLKEYIPINQKLLKNICGNRGIEILKFLVKNNYIISDYNYIKNKKAIGYLINYDLINHNGIKTYDNKYYDKFLKKLNEYNNKNLDEKRKFIIEELLKIFNKSVRLEKNKIKNLLNEFKKENIDKYNCQKVLIDKILNKKILITTDKFNNRIYSNYHNLSKELRKHILIDFERKITIDIKNSQLQTLAILMYKEGIIDEFFNHIVKNGVFYEFIMEKSNINDRKYIKKLVLTWLFSDCFIQKNIKIIEDIFKKYFPITYEYICNIKNNIKNGNVYLASLLQRSEANVVLNIQYELLKNNIKCLTIHDSFILKKSDFKYVKFIINYLKKEGYNEIEIDIDKEVEEIKVNRNNNNISYVTLFYKEIIFLYFTLLNLNYFNLYYSIKAPPNDNKKVNFKKIKHLLYKKGKKNIVKYKYL